MENRIRKFLKRVGKYAVFKEYPRLGSEKDIDLFIETRNFLDVEKAINESFTMSRCFYNMKFNDGVKRRYAVYSDGEFRLIDLGINAWYIRDNKVMSFDRIKSLSINIKGLKIIIPPYAEKLDKLYKGIIISPEMGLLWFYNFIKRIFHSEGRIIAITGPDGSGKTTVAKEVVNRLNLAFNAEYRYMGWSDHTKLTKAFYKVYKPRKSKDRLWAYYVEMMLRYVKAWLKKRFLGRIIVMDRYFYDKLNPAWYVPRPDITFLLMANPELIRSRKDELSIEKINQVYMRYENVSRILVDANKTVNHSVTQILDDVAISLIVHKAVLE